MNIAHLLPASASFPLKKHNGRYEWALRLAREQVRQGHTVTIYAASGSSDKAKIKWRSLSHYSGNKKRNNEALMALAFESADHDIFHSHFDSLHYSLAHLTNKPVVVTQHWFPDESIAAAARSFTGNNIFVVPVTHFMEDKDKELGIKTTRMIYHGIDLSLFTPSLASSNRFIFVGRITPAKGVREAALLAKKAAVPLDIIGKVNDADQPYWQSVFPLVDSESIRYLGPKPQEDVASFLKNARGFLFPSQHEEAFGQVTIEAQACGTPVIINDSGASRELVQDGVTGFVCQNEAEFLEAIKNISSIDRQACIDFAKQFSSSTMFTAYSNLYTSLVTPSADKTLA